jgi:hypothetical protein
MSRIMKEGVLYTNKSVDCQSVDFITIRLENTDNIDTTTKNALKLSPNNLTYDLFYRMTPTTHPFPIRNQALKSR